jgi:hypothetical protein
LEVSYFTDHNRSLDIRLKVRWLLNLANI